MVKNGSNIEARRGEIIIADSYSAVGAPYGTPMATSTGAIENRYRYGGKEWEATNGLNLYDFEARFHDPTFGFLSPDPLYGQADGAPHGIAPRVYCAANPLRFTDPSGMEIRGITKSDIKMAAQDIKEIFSDDVFKEFRNLIKCDGLKLKEISQENLSKAFDGVELNEDQQALVDIAVNTINSDDIHSVEYIGANDIFSTEALNLLYPEDSTNPTVITLRPLILMGKGLSNSLVKNKGGGMTYENEKGTHSIISKDFHGIRRAVLTGHELFGHGRSLALGVTDQNSAAVQLENLIHRVMSDGIQIDGHEHGSGGVKIPNPSNLPCFR